MKTQLLPRLLSLLLVIALLTGFAVPVSAAGANGKVTFTQVDNDNVSATLLTEFVENETNAPEYADTDEVRVSIVLEERSTVEAGYSTHNIAKNTEAMAYRAALRERQETVTAAIERKVGEKLDIAWNLTLAANIISANVEYGQIEAIKKVPGVKDVLIETQYEPMIIDSTEPADPNMATSSAQIGSSIAWASGYTGAGTRIAIIDTGTDENHQSFDAGAFEYSLAYQAGLSGESLEDYLADLDLLDAEEIASVASKLNAASGALSVESVYVNSKIPYGYNYVDRNYDTTHVNDSMGDHGSHVSGIAAANAYIPNGDGTYSTALNTVCVQGVAPDAQILTMKVFGKRGGAYDSDYTAAIEDAIILGCDAVNLSLGSGNPGPSKELNYQYQDILDSLTKAGTVVAISSGNSGYWVESGYSGGYLYNTDVNMQTGGSPGSYTNSLAVASVDNDGTTGYYVTVGDLTSVYFESYYKNAPMTTLAGEHDYVLIDGIGTAEDWAAIGDAVKGKIALCSRGETPFYEKANLAAEAGALALIVYNNMAGVLGMDLTDYKYTAPVVSISQADAAAIKAASETVMTEDGNAQYYTGKMTVGSSMSTSQYHSDYYTMSGFSSWGVPGSLELKPEITAPGGSIYSVFGQTKTNAGVDTYKVNSGTSMASPQVAGMAALVAQYIQEKGLSESTGLTPRQLTQSLLMSTAVPMLDGNSGSYYPVIQQGSGLGNVGAAICADSYILMGEDATKTAADGKVKVELGDDPEKTGEYTFSFSINNLTATDKVYTLSADFFTQGVFQYYANGNMSDDELAYYMDTYCTALEAATTFTVDGEALETAGDLTGLDFNGDGEVNVADGQMLLDYATGAVTALANEDKADLDADGDIDSYDAYLFFTRIENALMVPGNGSVDVTVTVTLSDEQKAFLNTYYPNGAYIEGYVFAEGISTKEGVLGTSHSIPVLGFYGNWSDPSMFDVGSRMEYLYGQEYRAPYLGKTETNYFVVSYPDEPDTRYFFGGNPLVPDETYMPERNAINSGSVISGVVFTPIRNAVASRVTGMNDTTGELLNEMRPGAFGSAYYNISTGRWINTSYSQIIKIPADSASEGDHLTASLTLAPEYYLNYVPKVDESGQIKVDENGNVLYDQVIDWDALGDGATISVPMVVDNTAPELKDVEISVLHNTMVVTASDNQYIAAVTLYNKAGSKLYAYAGAKQDIKPGEVAEYVLDINGVDGKRFLLQVTDYAMNTTTYMVETQVGGEEPLPEMLLFDWTYNYWTTFDKDEEFVYDEGNPEYSPTALKFYAATIVDHMVLASTDTGDLYIMPEDDLMKETFVRNMGAVVTDMAFNRVDKKIYGVADGKLVTIDKSTGALTEVGTIGVETLTLACDANGTFYCHENDANSAVYSFTLDTIAEPTRLIDGIKIDTYGWGTMRATGVQSMEIDPNTGLLCWASYIPTGWMSFFIEIDTKTGAYTIYDDRWDNFTCLIFPETSSGGGDWTSPTDEVAEVTVSATHLDLLKRGEAVLTANVLPWNTTDRTVTWSSDNEAVATVDQNGKVTAVDDGTAVISVTSNLNPTISATCTVTVESLDVTITGILQDADGKPQFYQWDLKNNDTWTGGGDVDTVFTSAAYNPNDEVYYVMDSEDNSWAIHEINESGTTIQTGTNTTGGPLWDMTYSEYFSDVRGYEAVHGIFRYYLYASKDPMNLDTTSRFNLVSSVSLLTGITSLGYEQYWDENAQVMRDTEHVILLDKAGKVWNLWIYDDAAVGGQKALYTSNASDLPCRFPGDNTGTHLYSSLAVGDDGSLYVSAFNGTTNELYRLIYDETSQKYLSARVCDFGEGVWPASITGVTSNTTVNGTAAAAPKATDTMVAEVVSDMAASEAEVSAPAFEATESELAIDVEAKLELLKTLDPECVSTEVPETSVELATFQPGTVIKPLSDAIVGENEGTVTVNVTAKDTSGVDVASTNGIAAVTYDAATLQLTNVVVNGDYTSKADTNGKVTFGYVAMNEIPEGGTIATLTFQVLEAVESTVTVEHKQVNNTKGTTEDLKVEFEHENTEIRGAIEATCTTAGYTGDTYCTDCGQLVKKGEIIQAKGHSFGEWTVTKAATCTEKGEETRTCEVCGATETRATDLTDHSYTYEITAPTCEEQGYTTYTCTVCGHSYKDDYVEATGHSFGEWETVKEATCTEKGEEIRTCEVCGETETRATDMIAHNYEKVVVEATCTEAGYVMNVCSVCGDSHIVEVIDATGHTYEKTVTAPTCTEQGYTTYTCHCGDTYVDDYVDALGHTFGEWETVKEATCTENGTETRTCEVCGEIETREIPPYCPAEAYTDVNTKLWYHEGVCYVIRKGLMEGKDVGIFAPEVNLSRAELVTVLYRMAGEPSVEGKTHPFKDVSADAWYAEAVTWAYNEEVVKGMSTTVFAPDRAISREQIALILFRYSGAEKVEENALKAYTDASSVSNEAVDAMNWAVATGLIKGTTDTTLAPKATAIRAQIAMILMRYCEK